MAFYNLRPIVFTRKGIFIRKAENLWPVRILELPHNSSFVLFLFCFWCHKGKCDFFKSNQKLKKIYLENSVFWRWFRSAMSNLNCCAGRTMLKKLLAGRRWKNSQYSSPFYLMVSFLLKVVSILILLSQKIAYLVGFWLFFV